MTSYRGVQRSPALSPDGTQVAFIWVGESGDNLDLYVQRIDGTGRVRLTTRPRAGAISRLAPDGKTIAFVRKGEIVSIPAAGGPERRITTVGGNGISWSPDSLSLAFSDRAVPDGPYGIFLISINSGARRRLTLPVNSGQDDVWPAFSPDGQSVAFVRRATTATDIYRIPTSGGNPTRVAIAGKPSRGLVWSPDGKDLFPRH